MAPFLRILETPEDLNLVEDLQRRVWPGSDTDIVPQHMLRAAIHNGGLVIGAFKDKPSNPEGTSPLLGFVFGFPGIYETPDGPRLKHCSHMLGVDPAHRDQGIGFLLKRAQWQMVRRQGLDRITWTYDPLLSRNAHLNITRLGGVCSTYLPSFYGQMRDELNAGMDSDRFEVDWWVNSRRVSHRLSRGNRPELKLANYQAALAEVLNATRFNASGWPVPPDSLDEIPKYQENLCLVEIPANFPGLKAADTGLAQAWRLQARQLFQELFKAGYLVTDFLFEPAIPARSFYVLSHGESTL
jgi:predicted GNAT superfamily acetyltransferase